MQPGAAPATVVVVDDDPDFLSFIQMALGFEGFEPVTFRTAVGALNYLEHGRAALVIIDHRLPDFDGLHLTELLRQNDVTRRVPVILTTAYPPSRVDLLRESAARAGALLLLKPFDLETLGRCIRRLLP